MRPESCSRSRGTKRHRRVGAQLGPFLAGEHTIGRELDLRARREAGSGSEPRTLASSFMAAAFPVRPSRRGPKCPCAARARPAHRRSGTLPALQQHEQMIEQVRGFPGQRRSSCPNAAMMVSVASSPSFLAQCSGPASSSSRGVGRARRLGAARMNGRRPGAEARRRSWASRIRPPAVRRPHRAHSNNDAERASRASCRGETLRLAGFAGLGDRVTPGDCRGQC